MESTKQTLLNMSASKQNVQLRLRSIHKQIKPTPYEVYKMFRAHGQVRNFVHNASDVDTFDISMYKNDSDLVYFEFKCRRSARDCGYEIVAKTELQEELEPMAETPSAILDMLYDDCLQLIFESPALSAVDLFSIACTCKRFYPLAKWASRRKTHISDEMFKNMDLWEIDMFFREFAQQITSLEIHSTDSPILEAICDNGIKLEKLSFECQINDISTVDAICNLKSITHINLGKLPISDTNLICIAYELSNLVEIEATCESFEGILFVVRCTSELERAKLDIGTASFLKVFNGFPILEEIDVDARNQHLDLTIGFTLNNTYYELNGSILAMAEEIMDKEAGQEHMRQAILLELFDDVIVDFIQMLA